MNADGIDVPAYLARIGLESAPSVDLAGLTQLQQAHMTCVPFENLHVFHKLGVRTDTDWSVSKVVDQRRGGWCFELNGAFALLLEALGFNVARIGAAVLLNGPSRVIDHVALEVALDQVWLVDVGFGESFTRPLAINQAGPQDGGIGTFAFMPSPDGLTLTRDVDGIPQAQYRFRRMNRTMDEFEPASQLLQTDPAMHWSQKPFATRLIDGGPERVTLLTDRLKHHSPDGVTETPVAPEDWEATLQEWFTMSSPTAM